MKLRKGDSAVFKEDIQFFKEGEWEPPYGILLLRKNGLTITSEGKDLTIPYKDIEEVLLVESAGTPWRRIYGSSGIKINYKEKGRRRSAPVFSSTIGIYAGILGHARDKKTAIVHKKIKGHIEK
jgi:hypothetical protein